MISTTETARIRPRPSGDLRLHLQTDTNAGMNNVQGLKVDLRNRQMKLPKSRGRYDVDSFQDHGSINFVKYKDDTLAPNRDNNPIIDPTSGFISAGADVDRNTGVTNIPNLQQADNTPNTVTPNEPRPTTTILHREKEKAQPLTQDKDVPLGSKMKAVSTSLPISFEGAPDPQLITTKMSNDPGIWNARLISDALIKNRMGGWTSTTDPRDLSFQQRKVLQHIKNNQIKGQADSVDKTTDWKDAATLKYIYTSSTQRSYEEVNWDSKLPPKTLPPATTLERAPDQVSHRFNVNKRYEPAAQYWQGLGKSFDSFQIRDSYHIRGPVEFCSVPRKNDQLPYYCGHVGGFGERDNSHQTFTPIGVLRSTVPRPTDTAHRPNIPGYTGCTNWNSYYPANSNVGLPPPQTTARVHRFIRNYGNGSPHKRTSRMSKMITLVPPCNPFNKVDPSLRPLEQYS